MIVKIILLVTVYLQWAESACDQNAINKVIKVWNNKPPTNLIATSDGTWTFVKFSLTTPYWSELKCFQQVVYSSQKLMKSYRTFPDATKNVFMDIGLGEKPGIIVEHYTTKADDAGDDHYVPYYQDNVLAFWSCVSGITGIKVKDYEKVKNDPKTAAAIKAAEDALKKAEVNPAVTVIRTECPAHYRK